MSCLRDSNTLQHCYKLMQASGFETHPSGLMNTFVERSSCTKSGYAICVAVLMCSCGLRFLITASSSARGGMLQDCGRCLLALPWH